MTKPTAANAQKLLVNQGKGGAVTIFPTICYIKPHEGMQKLNQELKQFVLKQEQEARGLSKSSIKGGYHSDRKFFENDNWAVTELRQIIANDALDYIKSYWQNESNLALEAVGDFKLHMSGWSVILREGDVSVPHLHPRANLSGVYYVTTSPQNEDEFHGAGNLVLADPRVRACVSPVRNQASTAMFSPIAGTTVMFPSYLEHYVLPFKGKEERISIAFNLAFSPNLIGGDY